MTSISLRAPSAWPLRAYLMEAKYESVRMLRMPAFAIPFLLLPVALYLFFGVVLFGAVKDPKIAIQIFTGFDIFGVIGPGLFGFGVALAIEREQGLLKLKRALPLPRASYLLAKMLMAMVFGVIVTVTLIVAAVYAAHLPVTAGEATSIAIVNTLGILPFCALGLFLGTRTTGKAAPAIANVLYLAMIYLSAILFPLPRSIEAIALASPAFHLNQLALTAMGASSHGTAILHVGVLAAVTLVLTALSIRRLERVG